MGSMRTWLAPSHLSPAVLLLLLALNAVQEATAGPLTRRIVPSLTEEVKQQLKNHSVSILLVLPGKKQPSSVSLKWDEISKDLQRVEYIRSFEDFTTRWHKGHSRPSQGAGVKEQFRGLRGLRSLLQHSTQHSNHHHHDRSLSAWGRRLLQVGLKGPLVAGGETSKQPPQPAEQQQQQQQQQQQSRGSAANPRVKVAILTLGEEGALHSGLASLAAAVERRLRSAVTITLAHSTHKEKPETLVTFDGEGAPIAVAVQESNVFRDAFNKVYTEKHWTSEGGGSGPGSSLNFTANVRKSLLDVMARYNVTSLLDSSCGSMHWMPLVLEQQEQRIKDFRFMGTDVACMLIDQHKKNFANHTNWNFECIDYASQPLPKGYDLVFSRDSLQHIPLHGTWQYLNNVRASGAKYLLVGSYIKNPWPNQNVPGGGYYAIDLLKPPFNVSKPLEVIDEQMEDGKHLLLFDVAKMTWTDTLEGLV